MSGEPKEKKVRGALWRKLPRAWLSSSVFQALTPAARLTYLTLMVAGHPEFGIHFSLQELTKETGLDERTIKRSRAELIEAGIVKLLNPLNKGGAHTAKAHYRWVPVPEGRILSDATRKNLRSVRVSAVPDAAAGSSEDLALTPRPGADVAGGEVLELDVEAGTPAPLPARPVGRLDAAAFERLVELLAHDRHMTREQVLAEVQGYGAEELAMLAVYYGVTTVGAEPAPGSAAPEGSTPEEIGRELVARFLTAWSIPRAPWAKEVAAAAELVRVHGAAAAAELVAGAQKRLCALAVKWNRATQRPYSFSYLAPHLDAELRDRDRGRGPP